MGFTKAGGPEVPGPESLLAGFALSDLPKRFVGHKQVPKHTLVSLFARFVGAPLRGPVGCGSAAPCLDRDALGRYQFQITLERRQIKPARRNSTGVQPVF